MTELEPDPGPDVAARLVEQLTRTNERLARLETALREQSLMATLQSEPARKETGAAPGSMDRAEAVVANIHQTELRTSTAREAEEHFRRGVALCQLGKYEEALAAWQQVLQLQPDNPFALANTGIVYTEQGRWVQAREMFVRVLSLQPDNPDAYYGLGMADAQLGNYTGAISAWENTLRLQPDNADAHYNLVLVKQRVAQNGSVQPLANESAPVRAPELAATTPQPSAESPPADDVVESERSSASGERAEAARRAHAETKDWKRVQGTNRGKGTQTARGAGRPSRPAGSRSSGRPLAILFVGAAIVGAILIVNNNRAAISKFTHFGSPPTTPASRQPESVIPKNPTADGPSAGGANPAATPTVQADTVTISTQGDNTSSHAAGPARPGKMQIRLGAGVTGRFRYWFVSKSNHAAPVRALPYANRSGIIALYIPAEYNQAGAQLRIMNIQQGRVARLPIVDVSQSTTVEIPNVGANLLRNSDFGQAITNTWSLETTAPGRAALKVGDGLSVPVGVAGKSLHFEVSAIGTQGWNVQCYQSGVDLKDNVLYLLSFWAKSDRSRPLHVDVIMDRPDWHPVGLTNSVKLSTSWQKYLVKFTASRTEPNHTRVSFILGEAIGPVDIAGVALRRSEGENKTGVLHPNDAVTVNARDFN